MVKISISSVPERIYQSEYVKNSCSLDDRLMEDFFDILFYGEELSYISLVESEQYLFLQYGKITLIQYWNQSLVSQYQ